MTKEISCRYEFLIRFAEFTGEVQGAHYQELRGLVNDEGTKWVSQPEIVVVPISLAPDQPGKPIQDIVEMFDATNAVGAAIINTRLQAERDQAVVVVEQLQAQVDRLQAENTASQNTIIALAAEKAEMQKQIDAMAHPETGTQMQVLRSSLL